MRFSILVRSFAFALMFACTERREPTRPPVTATALTSLPATSSVTPAASSPAPQPAPSPIAQRDPEWSLAEATDVLAPGTGVPSCVGSSEPIVCLLEHVYARDAQALALAKSLFARSNTIAGVHEADTFDGGFRGTIRIVPEPPIAAERRHLEWVAASLQDFDELFEAIAAKQPGAPPRYRWRALAIRFFRSVNRTTPSAFARDWTVGYNVKGSLLKSADSVRETLFHEIFHLNDGARRDWSPRVLGRDYATIVKKCGVDVACLAPFAPGDTKVRGGTYYAFQPDNGVPVREYGAELALRWYREHRAIVRGEKLAKPAFKCGPAENARSWKAIVDEFFVVDLVPSCGSGGG